MAIDYYVGNCDDGFSGSVLHDDHIFEVKPLNQRIKMLLKSYEYDNHEKYHIMTKRPINELPEIDQDDEFPLPKPLANMEEEKGHEEGTITPPLDGTAIEAKKRSGGDLTVEVGVFLDRTAYK